MNAIEGFLAGVLAMWLFTALERWRENSLAKRKKKGDNNGNHAI